MSTIDIAASATSRGSRLARANGIEIAYTELGDGPPLVLLHGALASTGPAWAGSSVAYVDHLESLARHFRVIAPDTRGSGITVHPGGPAPFEMLAADVACLIEALRLERPLLAGFSEGAATATIVALRRPELVRGLVNHGGFDYFVSPNQVARGIRQFFGGSPNANVADAAVAEQSFESMPPMADTFARMKADCDDAQGEGYWRTCVELFFDRHVGPVGAEVDDLAGIGAPTLILTGDRDMFCSSEAASATFRTLPSGELAVLPNTGHEITPAAITTMVEFLARHAPDG